MSDVVTRPSAERRVRTANPLSTIEWVVVIGALLLWTLLAYLFIFVFSGGHLCSVAQPIPVDGVSFVPLTQEQVIARVAECGGRPDIGAITVSGLGYLVFAAVLLRRQSPRRSSETDSPGRLRRRA